MMTPVALITRRSEGDGARRQPLDRRTLDRPRHVVRARIPRAAERRRLGAQRLDDRGAPVTRLERKNCRPLT
jgi:hypothetical protein